MAPVPWTTCGSSARGRAPRGAETRRASVTRLWSTRCRSPSATGIGRASQNLAALRLNDLPCPGISRCGPLDMSQPRSSRRAAASPSRRTVDDAPQEGRRHRCLPADVLPLPFIFAPQDGRFTDFTADLPQTVSWRLKEGIHLRIRPSIGHTFRPGA